MISSIIVVIDEAGDGDLALAFEEVVFQQNAVFEGLVPVLDLTPWI